MIVEKLKVFQVSVKNCINSLLPITSNFKPTPFSDIINNSNWDKKTKTKILALFKDYEHWCCSNQEKVILNNNTDSFLIDDFNIFCPDNAYLFCTQYKKYNGTTLKHRLRLFLRIMMKCTNDYSMSYKYFSNKYVKPKLKHLVTNNEMKQFINFLIYNKNYIILIIIELLYKFGVRIGSIAKLKVHDLDNNGILIFHEKNNAIVRRQLIPETYEKWKALIVIFKWNSSNYIFYPNKFPLDIDKRCNYFSNLIISQLKTSGCFTNNQQQTISAHMFRASHAVKVMKNLNWEQAQKELNHANPNTTFYQYGRLEERNINWKEEFEFDQSNTEQINFLFKKRKTKKNKNLIQKQKKKKVNETIENNLCNETEDNYNNDNISYSSNDSFDSNMYGDDNNKDSNLFTFNTNDIDNDSTIEKNNLLDGKNIVKSHDKNPKNKIEICTDLNETKNNFIMFENISINKKQDKTEKENLIYHFNSWNINFNDNLKIKNKNQIKAYLSTKQQDLFKLSHESQIILNNTLKNTGNQYFFNLQLKKTINNSVDVIAFSAIKENTLILRVSGKVKYFYEIDSSNDENSKNLFQNYSYFHTKNLKFDRILSTKEGCNLFVFFKHTTEEKANLYYKKVIDNINNIQLLILTKRTIKKGEKLMICVDNIVI